MALPAVSPLHDTPPIAMPLLVIPAQAGIHFAPCSENEIETKKWIPACAGMTAKRNILSARVIETMERHPCVFILASCERGTLYVGVTSDLIKRVWEHKGDLVEGFMKKYRVHDLMWFEQHETMESAIL